MAKTIMAIARLCSWPQWPFLWRRSCPQPYGKVEAPGEMRRWWLTTSVVAHADLQAEVAFMSYDVDSSGRRRRVSRASVVMPLLSGKCQTPLHRHRLRMCCTNIPADELTTILQLVVRQIHHQKRTKICHIPTSWHVEMLGSGVAMWQICCTTSCRIVVSLSVGGVVQHIRNRCPCSGVWH